MVTVDLETWVSLVTIAVFAIGLVTYLDRKFDTTRNELKADIRDLASTTARLEERLDTTRDELKADIRDLAGTTARLEERLDTTRIELKADNRDLAAAMARLEERTYELASGRRPKPLIVPPH